MTPLFLSLLFLYVDQFPLVMEPWKKRRRWTPCWKGCLAALLHAAWCELSVFQGCRMVYLDSCPSDGPQNIPRDVRTSSSTPPRGPPIKLSLWTLRDPGNPRICQNLQKNQKKRKFSKKTQILKKNTKKPGFQKVSARKKQGQSALSINPKKGRGGGLISLW